MNTCPVCAGKLNRLISGGVGVIFKGSGFYTTDYKNNSHQKYDAKSKKEEADTSAATDTKKEASKSPEKKPEKKTETTKN
jgi:predicted nucleic acid-binding Zn ribbon protein